MQVKFRPNLLVLLYWLR